MIFSSYIIKCACLLNLNQAEFSFEVTENVKLRLYHPQCSCCSDTLVPICPASAAVRSLIAEICEGHSL